MAARITSGIFRRGGLTCFIHVQSCFKTLIANDAMIVYWVLMRPSSLSYKSGNKSVSAPVETVCLLFKESALKFGSRCFKALSVLWDGAISFFTTFHPRSGLISIFSFRTHSIFLKNTWSWFWGATSFWWRSGPGKSWGFTREISGFYPGNPGVLPGISRYFTGVLPGKFCGKCSPFWPAQNTSTFFITLKDFQKGRQYQATRGRAYWYLNTV